MKELNATKSVLCATSSTVRSSYATAAILRFPLPGLHSYIKESVFASYHRLTSNAFWHSKSFPIKNLHKQQKAVPSRGGLTFLLHFCKTPQYIVRISTFPRRATISCAFLSEMLLTYLLYKSIIVFVIKTARRTCHLIDVNDRRMLPT
nr:MAG TPA: hypothetical protein [Caudoviricetes sp.]